MVTKTIPKKMTAEQFYVWANRPENEGSWYELEDGEAIEMPSPIREHAYYCWRIIKLLTEYVVRRGVGHLLTNDCGIIVARKPDTVRGADVILFLRSEEESDFANKYVEDVPDLIAEVVSPSDTEKRINRRVAQYLTRGIPLVWLIDPAKFTVTICRPNEFPKVLDETDELTGNGVIPEFACPVSDLFALPTSKGRQSSKPVRPRSRKGNRE